MPKTCETCPFFDPHLGEPEPGEPRSGWCRGNPPVPAVKPDKDGTHTGIWPVVWADDWCGLHPERRERLTVRGLPSPGEGA